MTVINEDYLYSIIKKLAEFHDIPIVGLIENPGYYQVYNRAGLIYALDVVLEEHRKIYATNWSPLKGRLALEHLILMKYKWHLDVIRDLKLSDIVILLQEELAYDNLPESAQNILKCFPDTTKKQCFPTIQDEEWDPNLIEQI
ncbi:hypothetical protein JEO90_13630 [Proteus vulgaris]|uniref:ECs1072 family phage-associated protein n=1 Tax=Proteus vulgaris TaxID=585 RepID=UPI0018E471FA|nr:hypothetical protein [Proteus vulgaris]MBI6544459.1 hypothetical protein [Proteus vulgaris]